MITNEQWKKVNGFTKYEVSNTGKVRNVHTKELKAIRKSKTGYSITDLKENGEKHTKYIHRLVAEAFVENAFSFPCVNHIDENKSNNHADNLEWCTTAYNNAYGTKNQRCSETKTKRIGVKVSMVDRHTNEVIKTFRSITEASKFIGVTKQGIAWALKSEEHTCCGYRWREVTE